MAILKGKLTKLSAAIFALTQVPNLITDLIGAGGTFTDAVNAPFSVVALIAAIGVIWGGIRRAFNYFENGIFGLKIVRAETTPVNATAKGSKS